MHRYNEVKKVIILSTIVFIFVFDKLYAMEAVKIENTHQKELPCMQRLLGTLHVLNNPAISKQDKILYLNSCLQPLNLKRSADGNTELAYNAGERPLLGRLRKLLSKENTNNFADNMADIYLYTHFEGIVKNFTIKKRKRVFGVAEDQISDIKFTVPLLLYGIKWKSPLFVNALKVLGANFHEKTFCIRRPAVARSRANKIIFVAQDQRKSSNRKADSATILQQAIDECHVELITAVLGEMTFEKSLCHEHSKNGTCPKNDVCTLYHRFIRAFRQDKGRNVSPGVVKFKKIISLLQEKGLRIDQLIHSPLEGRDASMLDEFCFMLNGPAVNDEQKEQYTLLIDWLYSRGAEITDCTFRHLMFLDGKFLWPARKDIEIFLIPLLKKHGNIATLPPSFDWAKIYLACIFDDEAYLSRLGTSVIEFSSEGESLNAAHLAAGYDAIKVLNFLANLDMALLLEKSNNGRYPSYPLSYAQQLNCTKAIEFFLSFPIDWPVESPESEEDDSESDEREIPAAALQRTHHEKVGDFPIKHESPHCGPGPN